jgi:hypothetical protein
LQRKIRKFTELSGGQINSTVARTPEEINNFCQTARSISKKTYQAKLLHLEFPNTKSFIKETNALAQKDQIRGYLLFCNKEPVSFVFCQCKQDVAIYSIVGYDPKFRDYSVGMILQYLLLQSLFAENRFDVFDFTEGEGAHKEFFATGFIECADIYCFKLNLINSAIISLHYLLSGTSRFIVSLLKKLNLSLWMKKIFRQGVTQ